MKRTVLLTIVILCVVILLVSCNGDGQDPCKNGHTASVVAAVAPTCTETGLSEGSACSVCGTVIEKQESVPALGHTSGDWLFDGEYHFKECTRSGCDISGIDRAEHEWVYGEIVSDPRPGVKTESNDICTVCNYKRVNTELYEDTEITEAQWNAVFSESSFSNVSIIYCLTNGGESRTNHIRVKNGTLYYNDIARAPGENLSIMEGSLGYLNAVATLNGKFSEFEYDADSGTYKGGYYVPGNTPVTMDCEITFSRGKMVSMTLKYGEQTFAFSYSEW